MTESWKSILGAWKVMEWKSSVIFCLQQSGNGPEFSPWLRLLSCYELASDVNLPVALG